MKTREPKVYHTPDWHPKLHALLGDIRGQYGYITKYGTVHLLGPLWESAEIDESTYETKDKGPTIVFSAASGSMF